MKLVNFIIGCIFSTSCLISLPTAVATVSTTKASISIVAFSASCLLSLPTATASTKATKAKAAPNEINESSNKIGEYFLGLVSCPGHCASGANFGGILAADNVEECNPKDNDQRWLVHQDDDGELIKFQSPTNGRCLGMAAHGGDDMLGATKVPKFSLALAEQQLVSQQQSLIYQTNTNLYKEQAATSEALREQQIVLQQQQKGTLLLIGQGGAPSPESVLFIIGSKDGKTVSLGQLKKVLDTLSPGDTFEGDLAHFINSSSRSLKTGVHVGIFFPGISSTSERIVELKSNIETTVDGIAVPTVYFLGKTSEGSASAPTYSLQRYAAEGGNANTGSETNQEISSLDDLDFVLPTISAQPAIGSVWRVEALGLSEDPDRQGKLKGTTFVTQQPFHMYVGSMDAPILASMPSANEDTCNGQLELVDCQDSTASWMITGAQLYSAACWIHGHSAAMTVNEDCTSLGLSLALNGAPEPITRAQSFMFLEPSFIETIPEGPTPPPTPPRPTPQPTPPPTFIVTFGSTPTVSTETT